MTTLGSPRNHVGCDGCDGTLPLTIADRERIHARPFIVHDQTPDYHEAWCAHCTAPLPHGLAALFHVCDDASG